MKQHIIMRVSLAIVRASLAICVLAILSTGCAPSANTVPSETRALPQPAPGKALVYYVNKLIYLGGAQIALDGISSSPLKRYTYVVWEVEPGVHQLEFQKSGLGIFTEEHRLEIVCDAGQTYYFQMVGNDRESRHLTQADPVSAQQILQRSQRLAFFRQDGEQEPPSSSPATETPMPEPKSGL